MIQAVTQSQEHAAKLWRNEMKISAFAISMVALLFIGVGGVGLSLAYNPQIMMTGFGMIYHMAGFHFVWIGLGLGGASLVVLVIAHYKKPSQENLRIELN